MKKIIFTILLALVFSGCLLQGDKDKPLGAAQSYEQTFDGLTDGDLNGQDSWSGDALYDVVATTSMQGTKALKYATPNSTRVIDRTITGVDTGFFYFTWLPTNVGSSKNRGDVKLRDSSANIRILLRLNDDSRLTYYYSTGYSEAYLANPYIPYTVYRVGVEVDTANDQYKINVNDGSWSGWLAMNTTNGNDITEIRLETNNSSGAVAHYFDFISPSYAESAGNNAPTISSVTDTSDPIIVGSDVTFSIDWADADAEGVKAWVCTTDAFTAGTGCDVGFFAASTTEYWTVDPIVVSTTTYSTDIGENSYYVFVEDDEPSASASTAGSFTVQAESSACDLPVGGNYYINETCYQATDYYTEGDIFINDGAALTILPGVGFSAERIIGVGTGKLIGLDTAQVKKKITETDTSSVAIPTSLSFSVSTSTDWSAVKNVSGGTWDYEDDLIWINSNQGQQIISYSVNDNGVPTKVQTITMTGRKSALYDEGNWGDTEDIEFLYKTGEANNEKRIAIVLEDSNNYPDAGYCSIWVLTIDDTTTTIDYSSTTIQKIVTDIAGEDDAGTSGGCEGLGYNRTDNIFYTGRNIAAGDFKSVDWTGTSTQIFNLSTKLSAYNVTEMAGIYYATSTQDFYILSHQASTNFLVTQTDSAGTYVSQETITGDNLEGITFYLPLTKMFILGEGLGGDAWEYMFYE